MKLLQRAALHVQGLSGTFRVGIDGHSVMLIRNGDGSADEFGSAVSVTIAGFTNPDPPGQPPPFYVNVWQRNIESVQIPSGEWILDFPILPNSISGNVVLSPLTVSTACAVVVSFVTATP